METTTQRRGMNRRVLNIIDKFDTEDEWYANRWDGADYSAEDGMVRITVDDGTLTVYRFNRFMVPMWSVTFDETCPISIAVAAVGAGMQEVNA